MSVRMKLSHSKTASRRAHHNAGVPRLVVSGTGARRRHFADMSTGMYRGKQIIAVGGVSAHEQAPKRVQAKDTKKRTEGAAPKPDASGDAA